MTERLRGCRVFMFFFNNSLYTGEMLSFHASTFSSMLFLYKKMLMLMLILLVSVKCLLAAYLIYFYLF